MNQETNQEEPEREKRGGLCGVVLAVVATIVWLVSCLVIVWPK